MASLQSITTFNENDDYLPVKTRLAVNRRNSEYYSNAEIPIGVEKKFEE